MGRDGKVPPIEFYRLHLKGKRIGFNPEKFLRFFIFMRMLLSMSSIELPKIKIVPFLLADLVLILTAGLLIHYAEKPLTVGMAAIILSCVALAAWIGVFPFLKQYKADQAFGEAASLASTVEQIKYLQEVATQITQVTGYWQTMQDQSEKTLNAASEVTDKMVSEARSFQEFMVRANDQEKAHLKLEADKLHRGEKEWLQVNTFIIDHIVALHQAAMASGAPDLIHQIGSFQKVCFDAWRRVGLSCHLPKPGAPFDPNIHRIPGTKELPPEGSIIEKVVAGALQYQGKWIRPGLVHVESTGEADSQAKESPVEEGKISEDDSAAQEEESNPS